MKEMIISLNQPEIDWLFMELNISRLSKICGFGLTNIWQQRQTVVLKMNAFDFSRIKSIEKMFIFELNVFQTDLICDLKPFDAKKMIEIDKTPQSVVLEGNHIGRGSKWWDDFLFRQTRKINLFVTTYYNCSSASWTSATTASTSVFESIKKILMD